MKMMRCSPFDFTDFYNWPSGYPGYGYYGYQPNYAQSYGVGQPMMRTKPLLHHEYGMPVEIPVVHEGCGTCPVSERKQSEAKKPRIPEDKRLDPDMMSRNEIQTKKQSSPKLHQKTPSTWPYGMRQVPVNDMESPESMYDDDDDECPFFYPEASSEMYPDGFPFLTSSKSPFTNVPANKMTSQKAAAKPAPQVNKAAEKSTLKKTGTTAESQTAAKQQHHEKVQQVPIVVENAEHASAQKQHQPPAKKLLTAMEQLENIQQEMEMLKNRVENFSGEKKDKEYIILDETMTSLLLRLDTIESNGVEEIRDKRRQLVRHVQECVQKLERKVGIVSPTDGTSLDEAEMMEVGDAETKSKEEVHPELTNKVMDSQGNAEEQTQVLDIEAEKAPLTEGSSDQNLRLEGEMQTQMDETVSSLQEMVVDHTEIACNSTTETEVNPKVENRTFEQMMAAGDAIGTVADSEDVKAIRDNKQVEEPIETNFDAMVSHCSENSEVAFKEKHLS